MRSKVVLSFATYPVNRQVRHTDLPYQQQQRAYLVPGVFLDNAQELVNALRPEPTYEQLEKRFNLTVQDAVAHGLTSVHDAGFDPISLRFFRR